MNTTILIIALAVYMIAMIIDIIVYHKVRRDMEELREEMNNKLIMTQWRMDGHIDRIEKLEETSHEHDGEEYNEVLKRIAELEKHFAVNIPFVREEGVPMSKGTITVSGEGEGK